jgi:hypothetical protein
VRAERDDLSKHSLSIFSVVGGSVKPEAGPSWCALFTGR